MWIIRAEQQAALDRAALEQFFRLARHDLRQSYPDRFPEGNTSEIDPFLASALEHARQYRLRSEFAALQFMHIRVLLGDTFDQRPECQDVVDALNTRGDQNLRAERARELAQYLSELFAKMAAE